MFYLPDAALFLLFFALLCAFGLAVSTTQRPIVGALCFPPLLFLGVWATLFYIVGSVGFLRPVPFLIGAAVVLLGAIVWRRDNLQQNARRLFDSLRALSLKERLLGLYLVLTAALLFVLTLAPPNGADYDSLVYHLAVPAQWLRDGRVSELSFDHHAYFPFVGEMLYALGLGVRGAVFAKMFHFAMLVLGALALAHIGRRVGDKAAGLWAAALWFSIPLVHTEATTAYIDLTFCAFTFAALALFGEALFWSEDAGGRRAALLQCGAFCGLCLGSKYFGWLVLGFLGAWLLARSRCGGGLAPLAYLAVPALALGGFWYARNVLWTGNPVFPFAFEVFGGRGWTAQMARDYNESQAIYGFGRSALDLVLLPFRLAMAPLNVVVLPSSVVGASPLVAGAPLWPLDFSPVGAPKTGLFDVRGQFLSSFVGPALLALGVPALLCRRKPPFAGLLAWLFAFLWTFWALTSQQIRYLLPALGLLCVLSGWFLATRLGRFRVASGVAGLCLVAWLAFVPFFSLARARPSYAVLLGVQTPEDYSRRTFAGYSAMQWIGANTPPNSRVAVYGEPRCFHLERPYFWADDAHNNLVPYATITSGAGLASALKSLGATHVLVNREPGNNGGAFGPPQPLFDQMVAGGQARFLINLRGYEVFELN